MVFVEGVAGQVFKDLALTVVFALLAISWDILAQTGMISLGQALFFGMGAYLAGIMNHYWGWSPFITLPLAAGAAAATTSLRIGPMEKVPPLARATTTARMTMPRMSSSRRIR